MTVGKDKFCEKRFLDTDATLLHPQRLSPFVYQSYCVRTENEDADYN